MPMPTEMHAMLDGDDTPWASWPQWAQSEVVAPDTVLFREGRAADELFWIIDGVIKLVGATASGARTTLGLRRGSSLLGAFTAAHAPWHQTSAVVVAPTLLCRLGANEFRARLADPDVMRCAREAMHQALQADLDDYTRRCLRDPAQRLAGLLATFVDEDGGAGAGARVRGDVTLPRGLDLRDLADLIQVSADELNQLLAAWAREGRVRREENGLEFSRTALDRAMAGSVAASRRGGRESEPHAAALPIGGEAPCPSPPAVDARVRKAMAVIETVGYARSAFSIRELSRQVSLSPWHLSRLLKQATGTTFRHLLTAARMEHARVALVTTQLSMKEIAASVGYNHQSDLTRHFKATYHVSPTTYRVRARDSAAVRESVPEPAGPRAIAHAIK